MDPHRMSDAELLDQLKNGLLVAGAELYERHKQPLYGFCLRMSADPFAAQDAVQETFLKMLSRAASINHGIALRSWLFSVARNELLMAARKHGNTMTALSEEEEAVADAPDPLDAVVHQETSVRIDAAIALLRPIYREAFLLRESEGLTYEEIAAVTGVSLSAVKSRIHKAREAMHRFLRNDQKEGE